jgi:predicted ATP-dependent endonuclease of OLD family
LLAQERQPLKIKSIQIQDAWSVCAEHPAELQFDERVTTIIGKNNSGKSNILSALLWTTSRIQHNAAKEMKRNEVYDYGKDTIAGKPEFHLRLALSPTELDDLRAHSLNNYNYETMSNLITKAQEITFKYENATANKVTLARQWIPVTENGRTDEQAVLAAKTAKLLQSSYQPSENKLSEWLHAKQKTSLTFLDGWRSLSTKIEGNQTIVQVLHAMQGANTDNHAHIKLFKKVESFFLFLTGLNSARLVTTADGRELNVSYRDRYLPIQSFGDGVVHTLLMAFEFMRKKDHIFLIEEPETHLHPELIRILLTAILNDENNNQFILTTHSPVLLDQLGKQTIYSVEYDGDKSVVKKCETSQDIHRVLDLLDVRLSDLLQANCVIWVEGPSDKVFLNRCLKILAPDLSEGLHYQITFYGGKLLAHYTADENLQELTNIMKICRHAAVLVDSDKENESSTSNATKDRINTELQKQAGYFWLTQGREIENYIADRVLQAAYSEMLPADDASALQLGEYARLEEVLNAWCPSPKHGDGWKIDYAQNKTRIMPLLMKHLKKSDLNNLGLADRMSELVKFIRKSNRPRKGQ